MSLMDRNFTLRLFRLTKSSPEEGSRSGWECLQKTIIDGFATCLHAIIVIFASFKILLVNKPLLLILGLCLSVPVLAQSVEDQKDRTDTLNATVFTSRRNAGALSKGKDLRTEVISSAGLMKLACCNLAESFENSASVTVGYSDAVTGARQIRLLGLSGVYLQMLEENRPVMRGLSAPFGR